MTEYTPSERTAPVDLSGPALDGRRIDLATLRGGLVVLNIWGSWCAPCRAEAPVLSDVSEKYASRGVRFVGVNVKDNPASARAFERRYAVGWPSLDDRAGRAALALGGQVPASVVPATVVLDRQGRVAARVLGAVEGSTLRTLLDTVLREAT